MNSSQKILTGSGQHERSIGILFCAALPILTILFYSAHLYSSDEGSVTNLAWHWWNHQAVYTDFHDYIPPGAPLLVLAGWKLFGLSYVGAKIPFIFFGYLSVLFTYLIAYKLTAKHLTAFLAAFFWLVATSFFPVINHNSLSSFLAVILTYFLLFPFQSSDRFRIIIIGIVNALIVWTLQTKGLFVFIASVFILGTEKRNRGSSFGFFLSSFFITVFLLYSPWPLGTIWHNLATLPFQADYLGSSFYNFFLYFLAAIFLTMMWITYRKTRERKVHILFVMQLALFLSMFNNFEIFHFLINISPFLIVAISYPLLRPQRAWGKTAADYALLSIVSIFYFFCASSGLGTNNIFMNKKPEIVSKIIKNSNNIYAGPFLPGLYFETKKINYFDTYSNEVYCNTSECQQKALSTFKLIRPEYAILDFEMTAKYNYFSEDSAVGRYVVQNYRLCPSDDKPYVYARDNCFD